MIFQQETLSKGFFISFYTIFIVAFIIFIIGIIITRWWAIKENWNSAYKPSIRLNLFWLICNLVLFLTLTPIVYGLFFAALLSFLVNIIFGALATSKLYEKKYRESLFFVLFLVIILLIIWFIVYLITTVILAVITIGLQVNRT